VIQERDIKAMERQMGSPVFTWEEEDYPCVPASKVSEVLKDEFGNPISIQFRLQVRRSVLPDGNPPTSGDLLTYDGTDYKVHSSKMAPTKIFYWVYLIDTAA